MPRKTAAVKLTGAQIDILLSLPEPALRDALKRLSLEPESARRIQADLIAAGVAELKARQEQAAQSAAMAELLPMIKAAGIELPDAVITKHLNRAAGVQADDGEA